MITSFRRSLLLASLAAALAVALSSSPGGTPGVTHAQESGWGHPAVPNGNPPLTPSAAPPPLDKTPAAGAASEAETLGLVSPVNDGFLNALTIVSSGVPFTDRQNTEAATGEAGEPSPCVSIGLNHTVWYSFEPAVTGIYQADTSRSNYDTAIAIYSDPGTGIGGLAFLECNDDTFGGGTFRSQLKFLANAGTTYAIQVGGFSAAGGAAEFNLTAAVGRTDPVGDAVDFGVAHPRFDVSNVTVAHDSNDILIRMEFATGTHAVSSGHAYPTAGYVDLDVDRNHLTGAAPWRNCCGVPPGSVLMGAEYYVDLFSEGTTPGFGNLVETAGLTTVASVPIVYTPTSITISIPRDIVGYPMPATDASVHVSAIIGLFSATDGWPDTDPVATSCTGPWNEDSQNSCFAMDGLWHREAFATIPGMGDQMLAYNTGCVGPDTTGCNYDVGTNFGTASSPAFGPLPATGGTLRFKTARSTETLGGCGSSFDATFVSYSTSFGGSYAPLELINGTITAGNQMFAESVGGFVGQICGDQLTPQTVTVPLPPGTTNVAFAFSTGDGIDNFFAGQFIDEILICTNPDVLLADGCLDNCPGVSNPSQADNDDEFHIVNGIRWIPDGLGVEGVNKGGDACDINDDNDLMCTDSEELGANINLGGTRVPSSIWDYADVPVPARPDSFGANGARSGAITIADVNATLFYVGAANNGGANVNGVDYDSDKGTWTDTMPANGFIDPGEIQAGNGVEDGAEYDRTPAGSPSGTLSGPPNGAITIQDVGVILSQVGDSCLAAPN